jgi:uncharacterized protein (TIGR02266 family)
MDEGERTSSYGMSIERRHHERHKVSVDLTISSEHQIFTALSGDVSEGGVFVATYKDIPIGTAVHVTLTLPEGPLEVAGAVRWRRAAAGEGGAAPPGIGIGFENLPAAHRDAIERFCATRAPLLHDE